MSGDTTTRLQPARAILEGDSVEEAWRWHLTAPQEVARLAHVLKQCDRVLECTTTGTSMGDTLPPGSRVRFRCGPNDPRVGDVVVLLAGPSDLLAHRVVASGRGPRGRDYLITRGDASILCDQPIQRSGILGIVLDRGEGDGWRALDAPATPSLGRRVVSGLHRWVMLAALEIDFRLAITFAAISYRLMERLGAATRRIRR